MITLLTGTPGAAKTLYTVDKLIRPLIGTYLEEAPDPDDPSADWSGDDVPPPIKRPRTIYTNIKRFLLDHVLIDSAWLHQLHVHADSIPGAVVVFDEVQRCWPNRPPGGKKPDAVEFLETHRHSGIDIILITQNPQLLDPAVRALVGRHLQVRKVAMLPAAIIYEWPECSSSLNFKNAFKKTFYWYNRRVYGLYKSARLHTPVRRSLPFAFWLLLFGIGGASYAWPTLMDRIAAKAQVKATDLAPSNSPAPVLSPASPAVSSDGGASGSPGGDSGHLPGTPAEGGGGVPRPVGLLVDAAPRFSGCIFVKTQCECFDTSGALVDGDRALCQRVKDGPGPRLALSDSSPVSRPSADAAADLALIQSANRRGKLPLVY